jgi:ABC-2 type transport system ATP-binding protein
MSAIAVEHLTKRFGTITAVDDLSFRVRPGSVTGFLGPNGAGKTTTLRVLLGLAQADSGRALIHGQLYRKLGYPAATVGAALERSGFHPGRSGRSHLRWIAAAVGLPRRRVDEVLELVGMTDAAHRRVGGYSMGMRQRLALAAALLGDPEVLVLDEPANGLDPQGIRWLREFLRNQAAEGRTVLVSSHVLAEVAQTVDDVVVIDRGRLVDAGPVADVTRHVDAGVRVRSPEAAALAEALERFGGRVERVDGEELQVQGMTAAQVGDVALERRVALHALVEERASLEDVFLRLTSGQENGAP